MTQVGDVYRVNARSGGFRVWQVIGVFLGGEHQESVVELVTLDREACTEGRMCVPLEILDNLTPVRETTKGSIPYRGGPPVNPPKSGAANHVG